MASALVTGSTIVLNEVGLFALLDSPTGLVGRDLLRRAEKVEAKARENATGPLIDIRSGALTEGLGISIRHDELGLFAAVGTDAQNNRPFGGHQYPWFVTRAGGTPGGWLSEALSEAV